MTEPVVMPDQQIRPFVGTLLGWFSIGGLVLALSLTVFISILSYAGFEAGEMGAMIGIFAVVGLFFLIPWLVLKLVLTIGIFKGRKWTVLISLVFTIIGFIPGFFMLGTGISFFLLSIGFLTMMLWAEIKCLKHPYYNPGKRE
ncbi:MAG: hypothetical protein U9N53_09195 [Bacteroidota bacterium]|nr:hypothetical protein [Bacteroidota bacterium]